MANNTCTEVESLIKHNHPDQKRSLEQLQQAAGSLKRLFEEDQGK